MHHVDFAREDVDIAVRHGDGNWAGLDVTKLTSEHSFAVCSPKVIDGRHHLKPSDVLKFPLMHLEDRNDWSRWLETAGVVGADPSPGPVLNRTSMLIDAAVDGQVIALTRTALAAWGLINERLLRPFSLSLRLSETYWIVCPQATAMLPKIKACRNWLLAQAAEMLVV